jgi:predicted flap endonuclease-1-like 5' DNA nuclease
MESSRKQHEDDARRYRDQYEKSEQQSETLRFKLGDIEKNWAELQRKEEESRVVEANNNSSTPSFCLDTPDGEIDDLTEIIGVGKVFAATLNRLGVFHFRQIAAFGAAELARVNSELKEFKGRIEHDDWIGQAKELHFRKYGDSERP